MLFISGKVTRVIAIGLGEEIEEAELNIIATQPASENVILLRDFAELTDTDKVESLIDRVTESKFFVSESKHFASCYNLLRKERYLIVCYKKRLQSHNIFLRCLEE